MRIRHLLCAVILLAASSVHAQILSVYGTFTPLHGSHILTGTSSNNTQQFTGFWAPTFGGGVTLNFLNLHFVKLGLDARGSTKPGTTGADFAEFSLRAGFDPTVVRIKPYAQIGVGYLATRTTNTSSNSSGTGQVGGTFGNDYATIGGHAGIDKPLIPFVDFRMIDIGYAHALDTGISFTNNDKSANVFSISTGLVAHF